MGEKEVVFLNQLISSLEEAFLRLEKAHRNNEKETFAKLTSFILQIQNKIFGVVDGL